MSADPVGSFGYDMVMELQKGGVVIWSLHYSRKNMKLSSVAFLTERHLSLHMLSDGGRLCEVSGPHNKADYSYSLLRYNAGQTGTQLPTLQRRLLPLSVDNPDKELNKTV
jgi:hypothetical protein